MVRSIMLAALLSACAGSSMPRQCQVGGECVSGVCLADGHCLALDGGDGPDGGPAPDGGASPDGGAQCAPNHDGVIARSEVTMGPGLSARFRVGSHATVSTAGVSRTDGTRMWDLSGQLAGDQTVSVDTLPMSGQWFAPDFAGASYASKLSQSSDLLGVFEVRADALLLRGVVSPAAGFQKTELTYNPPVTVLKFPLEAGASWQTTATVTGTTSGVLSAGQEAYQSDVDAVGDLATPYGTFPVLRVRVVLTRTVGIVTTTVRQYLFASECYGVVAGIVSNDNEPSIEFTSAAEARRLAP
jgi:hypothetical protein